MTRIADFSLRHRRLVLVFWTILLIAGGALAGRTTHALSYDFSLPGQPGYETAAQIARTYGNGGSTPPLIPVVTVPQDTTVAQQQARVDGVFAAVRREVPGVRVADFAATRDPRFVTRDGHTAYALVFVPQTEGLGPGLEERIAPILAREARATGFSIRTTGYTLLSAGTQNQDSSVLWETLLGALGALVVLGFVFASFLALVPLAVAAVSITSTFLVVLALTTFTDVSFVVQFLISLVGLGVAIDYSLLVVTRWREERGRGLDNDAAVRVAVRTAGHAVLSSGLTVAISLMALIAIPVPFIRSMGYGGMLIPLISTVVVLTLLPALLGGIGPRIDWPRLRRENVVSRAWSAWTRGVIRYRWAAAIMALGVLAALVVPLFGIKIGQARTDSLATRGPAYEALQTLRDGGVPAGVVTPVEVLVRGGDPAAVTAAARGVRGVATAFAPDGPEWRRNGNAVVDVIPVEETVDSAAAGVVRRVHDAVSTQRGVVGEAGAGALVVDYIEAVYRNFPLVLIVIASVTFVLLVRTFRSLVLPLKAVLLNLLSVSATFGAMVLFWQDGHGSEAVFGIPATGAITFWLPVMCFAFLFGLSMDYEVFILARIREEYDEGRATDGAVVAGMAHTGRLVTSAALILFLAFVALASTPATDVKVFATALGAGILLDATVVRALLVPALVSILGSWSWWFPFSVRRWRRSPGRHRRRRGGLAAAPTPVPVLAPGAVPAQRSAEGAEQHEFAART
jgi:RND superfamily putative drug exporter